MSYLSSMPWKVRKIASIRDRVSHPIGAWFNGIFMVNDEIAEFRW